MYPGARSGRVPEQSELSVYSLAWIEAASQEAPAIPNDGVVRVMQVGIRRCRAGGEDETTMVARVGGVIVAQHAWVAYRNPRGVLTAALNNLRHLRGFQVGRW